MKAILFDLDGVLVDVSDSYNLTIKTVVERLAGRVVSDEDIESCRSRGGLNDDWDLTELMIREAGGRVERSAIVSLFQKIYRGENFDGLILKESPLLKPSTLGLLRGRFRLGIVTGRPRDEAAFTLDRFEMSPAFSVVVTKDDLPAGRLKPDPLGITMALRELGVRDAIYVGDMVDDIDAAKRAGVTAVAVVGRSSRKEERRRLLAARGAAVVLDDVNDIVEVP